MFSTVAHYKFGYAVIMLAPLFAACSMITVNRTHAKGMDTLVGKSFAVVKDSFLIENACLKDYSKSHCLQIQVAGGHIGHLVNSFFGASWVDASLPATFSEFNENPAKFNDAYASTTSFGKTRQDIFGVVPKGSTITVTRLVSKAGGETGRCWVVYGRMEETPSDIVIEIPACGGGPERAPLWFSSESDRFNVPPKPNPAYLAPANDVVTDSVNVHE